MKEFGRKRASADGTGECQQREFRPTQFSMELVDLFNREDAQTLSAIARAREELARAIDIAAESLRQGGRLFYVGAGTSGRLGVLDAAECPPTFCTPPELVQGIIAGGAGCFGAEFGGFGGSGRGWR